MAAAKSGNPEVISALLAGGVSAINWRNTAQPQKQSMPLTLISRKAGTAKPH